MARGVIQTYKTMKIDPLNNQTATGKLLEHQFGHHRYRKKPQMVTSIKTRTSIACWIKSQSLINYGQIQNEIFKSRNGLYYHSKYG